MSQNQTYHKESNRKIQLIDKAKLYEELLTYIDENGLPGRIPDYDQDNFPITIDVKDVRRAILRAPVVEYKENF